MRSGRRWRYLLLWLGLCPFALAAEPLPEPLTLEHALSLADTGHPALAASQADLALSLADQQSAQALNNLATNLHARSRIVQRDTPSSNEVRDDHTARLLLRKPLFDFGRAAAARSAADAEIKGSELLLLDSRQQRLFEIMNRFFDVLLADLRFARDNEAMAIAFVRMERTQDRNQLGQVSDIDALEAASRYQDARRNRYGSEAQQRLSRHKLAAALNRPGELSSTLVMPPLPGNQRARPELESLEAGAMANNPKLRALRAQLEAARQRIEQARSGDNPIVHGELEGGLQSRKTNSTDLWRAGITLDVPLGTGGRVAGDVARHQAQFGRLQAELAQQQLQLSEALLEAWLALDTLYVAREEAQAHADYRELYLDRSRALYEQEVRADLGDAMVQQSEARLRTAQVQFDIALTWAHIDALTGEEPEIVIQNLLQGASDETEKS